MRKISAPVVLSVLLALAWLGYQANKPVSAQQAQPIAVEARPTVRWEYMRSNNHGELNGLGREGWEAYTATRTADGTEYFYLKKPRR
jgi:hypothetical protein